MDNTNDKKNCCTTVIILYKWWFAWDWIGNIHSEKVGKTTVIHAILLMRCELYVNCICELYMCICDGIYVMVYICDGIYMWWCAEVKMMMMLVKENFQLHLSIDKTESTMQFHVPFSHHYQSQRFIIIFNLLYSLYSSSYSYLSLFIIIFIFNYPYYTIMFN